MYIYIYTYISTCTYIHTCICTKYTEIKICEDLIYIYIDMYRNKNRRIAENTAKLFEHTYNEGRRICLYTSI